MEALLLALLGYPLSILANLTYDKLKDFAEQFGDIMPLKKLMIKSFYQSLKYHDKAYDEYSKKVVDTLRKAIKKDEEMLLMIFAKYSDDFGSFIASIKSREYQTKIANEIVTEYSLELGNYPNLMISIVTDCLNFYLYAFFNQMNEKEGIQTILIQCLKQSLELATVLDILKKVDAQIVTKNDFDELRKIVLSNYYNNDKEAQKKVEDYDQYLKNKFKYIELRGFSPKISGKEVQMELQDIFIPLDIYTQESIVPNILEENKPLLQSSDEVDDDDDDEIDSEDDKESNRKDYTAEILEQRNLVLLGDPGSGKSTLMKYMAVKVANLRDSDSLYSNMIPLFVRISDYSEYYKKSKKSLYEFITDYYDQQYQHIFKEAFECSNLLLLMDGLDEVTDTPLRIRVVEQVMDLIARYPFNRYVVTSRIVGYQESKLGGDFKHYKVKPFSLKEIELFSNKWYECIARHTDNDMEKAKEQADSLFSSIKRNKSVIRLATNPLLMTIIAMIHYKGRKLPSKRVELYEVSTETFLEYWVQLKVQDESRLKDKIEILEILAPIAFEIHRSKSNALIEEKEFIALFISNFKNIHARASEDEAKRESKEFIDFLRKDAGFFYEKGVDDEGNIFYGFVHLTFEEYLAAIELISQWSEKKLNLKDYIFNPRWVEIIRLASAQLNISIKGRAGRNQATQFIRDILSTDDPFPESHRPLQLACMILSDDVIVSDDLLVEILDRIITILSQNDFDELNDSFSKLCGELILSDYRDHFINRFEKELETAKERLLKNLSKFKKRH